MLRSDRSGRFGTFISRGDKMVIWMGWFTISIIIMAFIGAHRYSLSYRLLRILVEVPDEEIVAHELICVSFETLLIFSDETIWAHQWILLACGIIVLLLVQFILMRIAGKVTSGMNHRICEKRLNSILTSRKIRARMRYAHEFE